MENATDLRTSRLQKGLTIESLASLTGVRCATLSNLETGKRVARAGTKVRLQAVLGPVNWRSTFAGDNSHLLFALTEFVNPSAPGVKARIRHTKQLLEVIEQTI